MAGMRELLEPDLKTLLASGIVERVANWPVNTLVKGLDLIASVLAVVATGFIGALGCTLGLGAKFDGWQSLALLVTAIACLLPIALARMATALERMQPLAASPDGCARALELVDEFPVAAEIRDAALSKSRQLVRADWRRMVEVIYAQDVEKGEVLNFNTPKAQARTSAAYRRLCGVFFATVIGALVGVVAIAGALGAPNETVTGGVAALVLLWMAVTFGVAAYAHCGVLMVWAPIQGDGPYRRASKLMLGPDADPVLQATWAEKGFITLADLDEADGRRRPMSPQEAACRRLHNVALIES